MPPHDDDLPDADLATRTQVLQQRVDALTGAPCQRCGVRLCGHAATVAVLLGHRHRPQCTACIAAELGEAAASLAERAREWILRRDCFVFVWRQASEREGHGASDRPPCLFAVARGGTAAAAPPAHGSDADAPALADASWDAGDLGCGDLVLELRFRLADLPAGAVLQVTARDPAAPVDLPAWCGLCGHTLLHATHPHYWIRRRDRA